MIVPDGADTPPKRPLLDAREQPPQFMKDIFKRFQRLPLSDISTDSQILDFSNDVLPQGVRLDREISSEDLQSIYRRFVGDGKDFDAPKSQPVYSCEALPGRVNFFISCHFFSNSNVLSNMHPLYPLVALGLS